MWRQIRKPEELSWRKPAGIKLQPVAMDIKLNELEESLEASIKTHVDSNQCSTCCEVRAQSAAPPEACVHEISTKPFPRNCSLESTK